jgi:glycosyltransferase involved in cell wall biosynthesis
VPTGNARALSDAIRYFKDNPKEAGRMGANARKKALKFSWKKYMKNVVREVRALS